MHLKVFLSCYTVFLFLQRQWMICIQFPINCCNKKVIGCTVWSSTCCPMIVVLFHKAIQNRNISQKNLSSFRQCVFSPSKNVFKTDDGEDWWLLQNVTSVIQSVDQEVISCLKRCHTQSKLQNYIYEVKELKSFLKQIHILNTMYGVIAVWQHVTFNLSKVMERYTFNYNQQVSHKLSTTLQNQQFQFQFWVEKMLMK